MFPTYYCLPLLLWRHVFYHCTRLIMEDSYVDSSEYKLRNECNKKTAFVFFYIIGLILNTMPRQATLSIFVLLDTLNEFKNLWFGEWGKHTRSATFPSGPSLFLCMSLSFRFKYSTTHLPLWSLYSVFETLDMVYNPWWIHWNALSALEAVCLCWAPQDC